MLSHLNKYRIVLGSNSLRRKELLKGLNLSFETKSLDVDESYNEELAGEEVPCFLAKKKADAYTIDDKSLIITADTIVLLKDKVLGKPNNKQEAKQMLTALSGNTHEVITGVCIKSKTNEKVFSVSSKVSLDTLSTDEIDYYIEKYKPYDKAGSYGVQEWIGYIAVKHIEGSYFNIMGLPVQRLYVELKNWKD